MNHNPHILTSDELITATQPQVQVAQYEFIVAAVTFAFALFFAYVGFKVLICFLPKWWYLAKAQHDENA